MPYGKKIELFLVNGNPDSLIIAELSNWNGRAIKIPRIEVQASKREELNRAGVYFLFGKDDETDKDFVYIGESENIKIRLVQHMAEYNANIESFYWTTAVVFIGNDLNKALIRYLENNLVNTALVCKRYKVLTKNTYKNTVMKESDKAIMEEFAADIKIIINALGYKVLERYADNTKTKANEDKKLYINIGEARAIGMATAEGFVVLKDSTIAKNTKAKFLSKVILDLRSGDKVKDYKTLENILFTSSSAAADFVSGYHVSGPATWKNKDGKLLKDIEGTVKVD